MVYYGLDQISEIGAVNCLSYPLAPPVLPFGDQVTTAGVAFVDSYLAAQRLGVRQADLAMKSMVWFSAVKMVV